MAKTKKHSHKKISHRPKLRWLKLGGYIGLKHVAWFTMGLAALGIAFVGGVVIRPAPPETKASLASLSHSSDAPSTIELIKLINASRIDAQQMAINTDARLQLVAEARLKDMVANQYYSHQNLKGKYYYDFLNEQGLAGAYSCENLSIESSTDAQPYIQSWLTSKEGHRECMLSGKVTAVGIATGLFDAANGDKTDPTYLVVTIYANPPEILRP